MANDDKSIFLSHPKSERDHLIRNAQTQSTQQRKAWKDAEAELLILGRKFVEVEAVLEASSPKDPVAVHYLPEPLVKFYQAQKEDIVIMMERSKRVHDTAKGMENWWTIKAFEYSAWNAEAE